jgi:transposase
VGRDRVAEMEYTQRFRQQMVRKMLPPARMSAGALARESGVAQATLSKWLREARSVEPVGQSDDKGEKKWTAAEKLRAVIESAKLKDGELGEFLRREGLHEAQLQGWRADAEAGLTEAPRKGRRSAEAKRIRELERELRRKEKALAEAAALIVLKKKAAAIWGEEDDDTSGENES